MEARDGYLENREEDCPCPMCAGDVSPISLGYFSIDSLAPSEIVQDRVVQFLRTRSLVTFVWYVSSAHLQYEPFVVGVSAWERALENPRLGTSSSLGIALLNFLWAFILRSNCILELPVEIFGFEPSQ